MTESKKYSIREIHGMTEQFKTLITEVVTHLISQGRDGFVAHHKTFTVDGNNFEFGFRPSRALQMQSPQDPIRPETVLAEAGFRGVNGYLISTCASDYENGITDQDFDRITEQFINVVIANMARVYFRANFGETVTNAIDNKNFDIITKLSNGRVKSSWDENGFGCVLLDADGNTLIMDTSFNLNPSPNSDYAGRCYRYTELAFQKAISSLDICTDNWKATIQYFPYA